MGKNNKVANVEVVVEDNAAESIIEMVLNKIPSNTNAKEQLEAHLASEADHNTARTIVKSLSSVDGFDPIEVLEMQINTYKDTDKDRAKLASQKLELIKRYNKFNARTQELREEVNSSYALLDEVIAGLIKVRGVNAPKGGSGRGGKRGQSCTVTNTTTNSVVDFPSVNRAVDELIPKEKRSPKWVEGAEGDTVDKDGFKLNAEGKRIHELDKDGNPKYLSMNTKNGVAKLKAEGYTVELHD